MRALLLITVVLTLLLPCGLSADPTTILIPTLYTGPGAFGSTWWSDVVINNHAADSFSSPGVRFLIQCPIPEGCESDSVPAGQFATIAQPRPASGLLLHGDSFVLSVLAFRGRFGQGTNYLTNGSELPIVRESAFTRSVLRFPYVALYNTLQPVRSTLRIYGPDAIAGTMVRVEVRPWYLPSGDVLASTMVILGLPAPGSGLPVFPASVQLALEQIFPFELLRGSNFNVSIVPLPLPSGQLPRIWAFISSTEDATQLVSIQTPQ